MPGFTADASLYKANKHFVMVSLPGAGTDGQRVQPQAKLPTYYCVYNCFFGGGGDDMIDCLGDCFGVDL